jgi:hypothetical protein|tara:strand:+ start:9985 stop:10278 length:294 start_codon:yes stop_codon:yes gene_type:complete
MNKIVVILLTIIFLYTTSHSCGSAVVPYVPTQGNSSAAISSKFYILQKGVIAEMFNTKRLQPLFRNVILSGNARKKKNLKRNPERESQPVLNIHRLH